MSDAEFSVDPAYTNTGYELPICTFAVVWFAGIVLWMACFLSFPHIYGKLKNLIPLLIVVMFSLFLIVYYTRALLLLLFEVRGASLSGRTLTLKYRYLGDRLLHLPYAGRATRNVKLFNSRAERGYQFAHEVSRRPWNRIVIPLEMSGSEQLVEILAETPAP